VRRRLTNLQVGSPPAPGADNTVDEKEARAKPDGMVRAVSPPPALHFELDDLSRQPVRDLVARHLAGMHAQSPPESVHALALDGLKAPSIRFWSVWSGGALAGMGALRRIDAGNGEIKSMRVADAFLGQGVGRGRREGGEGQGLGGGEGAGGGEDGATLHGNSVWRGVWLARRLT
jgi:hypothetical protein